MARNEETLDIVTMLSVCRRSDWSSGDLLDPMLATGGTLIESIKFPRERGAESRLACA